MYDPPAPSEPEEEAPKPKKRNARARYRLTPGGEQALTDYRAAVKEAQTSGGRDSLEDAQAAWATAKEIEAVDALILDELDTKEQTILELTRSLDTCGVKRPTIEGSIDRLSEKEMAEPAIKEKAEPDPPAPRYYGY